MVWQGLELLFVSFNTIAGTIYEHYDEILNYFVNSSTNAFAQSFNAKIKAFRAILRGVTDLKFSYTDWLNFLLSPPDFTCEPWPTLPKAWCSTIGPVSKRGINSRLSTHKKKRVSVFLWKLSLKKVAMTYSPKGLMQYRRPYIEEGINGRAEPYRMKIYKQKKESLCFLWKLSLKKWRWPTLPKAWWVQ